METIELPKEDMHAPPVVKLIYKIVDFYILLYGIKSYLNKRWKEHKHFIKIVKHTKKKYRDLVNKYPECSVDIEINLDTYVDMTDEQIEMVTKKIAELDKESKKKLKMFLKENFKENLGIKRVSEKL